MAPEADAASVNLWLLLQAADHALCLCGLVEQRDVAPIAG